jgi:hypothetical protein
LSLIGHPEVLHQCNNKRKKQKSIIDEEAAENEDEDEDDHDHDDWIDHDEDDVPVRQLLRTHLSQPAAPPPPPPLAAPIPTAARKPCRCTTPCTNRCACKTSGLACLSSCKCFNLREQCTNPHGCVPHH